MSFRTVFKMVLFVSPLLLGLFATQAKACTDEVVTAVGKQAASDFPGRKLIVLPPDTDDDGRYVVYFIQVNESTQHNAAGLYNALAFYKVSAGETCDVMIQGPPFKQ